MILVSGHRKDVLIPLAPQATVPFLMMILVSGRLKDLIPLAAQATAVLGTPQLNHTSLFIMFYYLMQQL